MAEQAGITGCLLNMNQANTKAKYTVVHCFGSSKFMLFNYNDMMISEFDRLDLIFNNIRVFSSGINTDSSADSGHWSSELSTSADHFIVSWPTGSSYQNFIIRTTGICCRRDGSLPRDDVRCLGLHFRPAVHGSQPSFLSFIHYSTICSGNVFQKIY